MPAKSISEKAAFDFVRYASVWEDADILCAALAPVAPGGRLVSIASSGDNALALLTLDPAEVVAVDLNASQLACVELRVAAIRELDRDLLLQFLGVYPSVDRAATYQRLRTRLSPDVQAFWDQHSKAVEQGIIHAGRFERYLRLFGTRILPMIHSRATRYGLLSERSEAERIEYFEGRWNTWMWRTFFNLFFSRRMMGWLGRDPAFFDHAEGAVSERLQQQTRHAFTAIPTHNNPYLTYIITGNYSDDALPLYLRSDALPEVRKRLDRLSIVHGTVQQACVGEYHGFNLSDIFEYMSDDEFEACYGDLVSHCAPKGRLAYWNMQVPRCCPKAFDDTMCRLDEESDRLHQQDKAWFYRAFHIDERCGGG